MDTVVIDPKTDDEIKINLLRLLEKKKISLQSAAACHEYLESKYNTVAKGIEYTSLTMLSISFILSMALGGECAAMVNVPWTITTGVTMLLKGSKQIVDYSERAMSNERSYKAALDLADDIEYVILKNNHTKRSLQQSLEVYDERIKSFRKTEATIPLDVKHRFLPD